MTLIGERKFDVQPAGFEEVREGARVNRFLAGSAMEYGIRESQKVVTGLSTIEGIPEGFYNAAAFIDSEGRTVLVGRQVKQAGGPGIPDVGVLLAVVLDEGVVVETKEVWSPELSGEGAEAMIVGDLIEDPRAVEKDGEIAFDVSRVSPLGGKYTPYPAFTDFVSFESLMTDGLPDTTYLENRDPARSYMQSGKNATRIWPNHVMFRPDSMDHSFMVHRIGEDGVVDAIQELPVTEIPVWGEYRMGSTMPPVWLNDADAVLIVHGITFENGIYRYTIGSARLHRDENGIFSIDNVSPSPHLTPEMVADLFPEEQVELYPELRQALYATGGVVHRDDADIPREIELFPNVGDTRTISATLSVEGIVRNWSV